MITRHKVLSGIIAVVFLVDVAIFWSRSYIQHLPPPTEEVKSSHHDGGYEDAWIQDVDKKSGLVMVTTIISKISIIFKPSPKNLKKFHAHLNWIAPVTFQCTKKKKEKCDYGSPYKLFISNELVEVKQLKFPKN